MSRIGEVRIFATTVEKEVTIYFTFPISNILYRVNQFHYMNKISFDFSGTTTVITGGSSGIGLAAAELIAASGGNIIVSASRSSEKTKQALSNILSARSKSTHHAPEAPVAFEYDAGDETSVTAFFAQVAASTKRVDYIIHSAAISPDEDYENQD